MIANFDSSSFENLVVRLALITQWIIFSGDDMRGWYVLVIWCECWGNSGVRWVGTRFSKICVVEVVKHPLVEGDALL